MAEASLETSTLPTKQTEIEHSKSNYDIVANNSALDAKLNFFKSKVEHLIQLTAINSPSTHGQV